VVEWAVELQPFKITFETTKVIKSKELAEFMANGLSPTSLPTGTLHFPTRR
jgi:hypothetical protein